MTTPAMNEDRYADTLRARFAAAAPPITTEPTPIIARARRRRRQVRTWGALTAVVALVGAAGIANALVNRDPSPPVAPPTVAADGDFWVSAAQVRPGDDLVVIPLTSTGPVGELFRWDDGVWDAYRLIRFCPDHWGCSGSLEPYAENWGGADLLVLPGETLRFSTEGLDAGWYRVGDGGQFQITADAAQPAPLSPVDAPALSVYPALLPVSGGEVQVFPLAPSDENGMLTHEDLAAITAGMPESAAIERWDGSAWASAGEVELRGVEGDDLVRYAELPSLDPGAYRLVRSGPASRVTGNFWVREEPEGTLEEVAVLDSYDGYPDAAPGAGVDYYFGAVVRPEAGTIEVYTTGSSSCPTPPTAVTVRDGTVVVHLGDGEPPEPDRGCTDDLAPHTYVIAIPDGVAADPTPPVELRWRDSGEVVAGQVPDVAPVPDDDVFCMADQTDEVCALNLWLDELLVGAGFETSFWDSQSFNGARAIVVDGVADIWVEAFPAGATSEVFPLEFERETSARVGVVEVEHGTFEGASGGPGGQFTCGGVWVRLIGSAVPAETAIEAVDAVAAQVDTCPADIEELVTRYADVMNP